MRKACLLFWMLTGHSGKAVIEIILELYISISDV